MKRFLVLLMVIGITLVSAQGFSFDASENGVSMTVTGIEDTDQDLKASDDVINEIVTNLEKLQKLYKGKLSKLDGKRADKLVDNIYELLAEISTDGNVETSSTTSTSNINININEGSTTTTPQVVEEEVEVEEIAAAMSSSDFNNLVSRIESESFDDDKLRVIRTAKANHNFNVSQIVRLIGLWNFSDDQLNVLRISYPGCVDTKNNYQILDAFTYSSDKEEAELIINQ